MDKILIIGLGIIGGSLVKKIASNETYELHVLDCNETYLKEAINNYGCYKFTGDYSDYRRIILATPIKHVFSYLDKLKESNYQGVVYDCSSTKLQIENYANDLGLNYIGLHPMCGSEKSGFTFAEENLFVNKTIICSQKDSFAEVLTNELGANIKIIDSGTHDKLTAEISHVPQLLSLIINQVSDEARLIAGNGFKDMTRISSSPYKMWEDILKTNDKNILPELKEVRERLDQLIDNLGNKKYEDIQKLFKN